MSVFRKTKRPAFHAPKPDKIPVYMQHERLRVATSEGYWDLDLPSMSVTEALVAFSKSGEWHDLGFNQHSPFLPTREGHWVRKSDVRRVYKFLELERMP